MRILFINPNSTQSMTDKVHGTAASVAPPNVEILSATSRSGPPSIQGEADGKRALPGLFDEIKAANDTNVDACVIACFDDTGLAECRALTHIPVLGIGEAAFHACMMLGTSFSVVTTLSVSIPVIEHNLQHYGLASSCRRVRASEVPVLDLEKAGSDAEERIASEIAVALVEDQCSAIVLGCAGMAPLAARLSQRYHVPVVDGVVAATGFAMTLVSLSQANR
jgi:allantoin racemase